MPHGEGLPRPDKLHQDSQGARLPSHLMTIDLSTAAEQGNTTPTPGESDLSPLYFSSHHYCDMMLSCMLYYY